MRGISNGSNSRPLTETIAETGPGLPDEAAAPGELRSEDIGRDIEAQAERLRQRGWTGACGHADDTEAHPS
jgi:hypothetical protein